MSQGLSFFSLDLTSRHIKCSVELNMLDFGLIKYILAKQFLVPIYMKLKSVIKIVLPLLILLAAFSGFSYLKSTKSERVQAEPREKVWQVDVISAIAKNLAPELVLYGEVQSSMLQKSGAPAAGIVARVLVQDGEQVFKGQSLVLLEQQDFTSAVDQVQADVDEMQAQINELDLKHQANLKSLKEQKKLIQLETNEVSRIKRLQQKGLGSDSLLAEAKSTLGKQQLLLIDRQAEVDRYNVMQQQLQASLLREKSRLRQSRLALKRSHVIAAFDAVVVDVPVAAGDRVRIADELVTIYPLKSLEIRARLPASYQAEIQQVLNNQQRLQAVAYRSDQEIRLELNRIAGQASLSGVDVFFKVISGEQWLRLGNLLKIQLSRAEIENVYALPTQAIYGNSRLYIKQEQRMVGIDIQMLGRYRDPAGQTLVLVKSPELQNDDQIITTHLPNAVTGLKVRVGENQASIEQK